MDYHYWLLPATPQTSVLIENKISQISLLSDDDYTNWLHPESLAFLSKSTTTNKIAEFPSIFCKGDYSKWLHPESLARASKDFAKCLSKNQTLNPVAPETGLNFIDSLVSTSASNVENIWLASGSVNQTLPQHSGLSVSDVLNEMRQTSGKLAHVQNSWAQWLKP